MGNTGSLRRVITFVKAASFSRASGTSILFVATICGVFASSGLYFFSSAFSTSKSRTGSRPSPGADRSTTWISTRQRSTWRRN